MPNPPGRRLGVLTPIRDSVLIHIRLIAAFLPRQD